MGFSESTSNVCGFRFERSRIAAARFRDGSGQCGLRQCAALFDCLAPGTVLEQPADSIPARGGEQ